MPSLHSSSRLVVVTSVAIVIVPFPLVIPMKLFGSGMVRFTIVSFDS